MSKQQPIPLALALAVGCAAMLTLDTVAVTLGIYSSASPQAVGALLILPGFFALWKRVSIPFPLRRAEGFGACADAGAGAWMAWTLASACAALLLACASAP